VRGVVMRRNRRNAAAFQIEREHLLDLPDVDGGVNPHINGGARLTRTVNNEAPLTASVGVAGPSQNGSLMSLRLGSSGGERCSRSRSCRARS
jgi:hypothetical protein